MEGQSLVYMKLKRCLANKSCKSHFEPEKLPTNDSVDCESCTARVNSGNLNQ